MIVLSPILFLNASAQTVPYWIKNTANWWANDKISDKEFLNALQWLIDKKILHVPNVNITNSLTSNQTQSKQSLMTLLPTRNDIGTEWKISKAVILTRNTNGFVNGSSQNFTKIESDSSSTVLTVNILQFNSFVNTENYFDSRVSSLKLIGGYKENSTSILANCYGTSEYVGYQQKVRIFCVKDDVFASTVVISKSLDIQHYANQFENIIINKIHVD